MEENVNILVVDDDQNTLLAYESILNGLGLNIVRASSGREALSCLLHQEFALILLDVKMPDIDGFETARLIRKRPSSSIIPIIFITGASKTELDSLKGYWIGADDFLCKPVCPEILRAKVTSFVDIFKRSQKIQKQANQLQECNDNLEKENKNINSINQQLKSANQELETFSYTLTHDLRNSVTDILGFTEMILDNSINELHEDTREYLSIIQDTCHNMTNVIDAILILFQIKHKEIEYKQIDLTSLASAIALELKIANPDRHVDFVIHKEITCIGDPHILLVILNNLIGNAWKYTAKQPEARIEIGSIKEESGKTVYFVKDNGVGFDEKNASKLFTPFQRLHSKEEFLGFGIGLATVQRAIKWHHGNIWANGEVGRGATFCFTLANEEDAVVAE
ncbi:MAG: response regulator [Candidatus Desantisbacteria bacterium]